MKSFHFSTMSLLLHKSSLEMFQIFHSADTSTLSTSVGELYICGAIKLSFNLLSIKIKHCLLFFAIISAQNVPHPHPHKQILNEMLYRFDLFQNRAQKILFYLSQNSLWQLISILNGRFGQFNSKNSLNVLLFLMKVLNPHVPDSR